ncbi:hypothetical protein OYC64_012542 [Pagothenia borchgrevinki]|uniref:Uncharacterized protein n=1 Tax=Pagothenia borchgrevinki TaxID=8213 RepID=A0ABD2GA21_PAGBO
MSFDRHSQCESCLGVEHANAALTPGVSCSHCAPLPLALRQQRADALAAAAAAEDDWPVQEAYSVDKALDFLDPNGGHESDDYVPSIHGSPGDSPIISPLRTEGTDMGPGVGPAYEPVIPLSAATALPSIGGILLELPEIISKAA